MTPLAAIYTLATLVTNFFFISPQTHFTIDIENFIMATFGNYAGTESKSKAFHYSQAVKLGNVVRISGQGGWDAEGNVAPNAAKQVELALENIEKALQSVEKGVSWKNVYAIRSYHTNIDESADLCIEGWRRVMPDHRPVWTCVEITKLGIEGMQVEIEVEALVELE
ncbi:uncharacterized protein J4E84_001101 [Alternaria hordeiaustralica]|uniref:uncharacterized protein n=1 Tax=Alternaria hordeiaustralica TaxID=1187925 RepID=UPI0020C2A754|nr:uncharacterized protein J4E84_001101 [Alternaria hordeiaustralica]KAI4697967.1 hypothetical protein J4E84_001101 [Alternaria hordeiaustralica]